MLRDKMAKEIDAWLIANRSVRVAQNLLDTKPEDPVLSAKLRTAQSQRKEATAVLRAALQASGHSLKDLQAELESNRAPQ